MRHVQHNTIQDIIRAVLTTFSDDDGPQRILVDGAARDIQSRNIRISYHALATLSDLTETRHIDDLYDAFYQIQPHLQFVLWHTHHLDRNALFHVLPKVLIGYAILDSRCVGICGNIESIYCDVFDHHYDLSEPRPSWSVAHTRVIEMVLDYVFAETTRLQGVFDETLFCFRVLFSDAESVVEQALSCSHPDVVNYIKDFFEHDLLRWDAKGLYTPVTLLAALLHYSGLMFREHPSLGEEKMRWDTLMATRIDHIFDLLSEERLLTFIAS